MTWSQVELTAADCQLLWLAGVSWDGIVGADRQMVAALSGYASIFWVDPPVSPATPARLRYGSSRPLRPRIEVINDRVTRMTPVALPGLSRPGVRAVTAGIVRRQVKSALRRMDFRPAAAVVTCLEDLLGCWGPGVVNVLYGTDNYVAGAELMGLSVRRQRRQELRALARADVVTAVTPQLAQRWTDLGASPRVVLPGCLLADIGAQSVPAEVADLPGPVIGLVGQLSDRLDMDILEAVADSGLSLLIVGPLDPRWEETRFEALTGRPHVRYVGAVPPERVPSYLAAIDVGITPYRDMPFNRSSFPLKTVEYLGAGIPVVSTDLPTARWLREDLARSGSKASPDDILALARNGAEFAEAVRRIAVSERSPAAVGRGSAGQQPRQDRATQCVAFASRHTWSRRGDDFASAIGLSSLDAGRMVPVHSVDS